MEKVDCFAYWSSGYSYTTWKSISAIAYCGFSKLKDWLASS